MMVVIKARRVVARCNPAASGTGYRILTRFKGTRDLAVVISVINDLQLGAK